MDKKNVEVQKRAIARFRARVIDYKKAFNSEAGRRVLYDMMIKYHVINPLPKGQDRDQAEGARNVVLEILTILKVDPEQMTKLIREADAHAGKTANI